MTARRPEPSLRTKPSPSTRSKPMKRIAPTLASLLLLASALRAEPDPNQRVPDSLDLSQAIKFALENNYDIRTAKEQIRQQEGVVVTVRAAELPTVAANGTYQLNQDKISSTIPQTDNFWTVSVLASETLYAGGGVTSSINNAQLTREAAVLQMQSVINSALLDVRTKFYTVLLDRELVKVQEENIGLLENQLKDATNKFEAGTVSSFDKLQATVALANGRVPLINAKNGLRIAVEQLRQSLGFSNADREDVRKVPEFKGELVREDATFDLQSALDAARTNRPELLRLAKLEAAGVEAVTTAKSTYYPNVGVQGGFEGEKNPYGGPGTQSSVSGWYVGLKGQWNIFDGMQTRGHVIQANSQLAQAKLSTASQTLAVDVEVRQAFSSWQEANELADATKQTVQQAEESLRLATARYESGSATHLDVLQAQTDLTQARSNLVQANYTHAVAVASLREAMGLTDALIKE